VSGVFGAGKAGLSFIPPQIPTPVEQPPAGDGWIHEVKHDGYRMQLIVDGSVARIFSRRGHDWTAKFPHIGAPAAKLPCQCAIIDGEMVVQDERGVADFDLLRSGKGSPVLVAFDLLQSNLAKARDGSKLLHRSVTGQPGGTIKTDWCNDGGSGDAYYEY
jgi:bifunctional non-homologous end joining protein LigD